MLSVYQQQLCDRFLAAPVLPAPSPWRPVLDRGTPIGGLLGIGFTVHPGNGHDLVMVVSHDGHGLFDAATGEKIARDREPGPGTETPDADPDLACPGLGPVVGTRVRIAGLFGRGLHATTPDGWTLDVVAPEWPHHRVLLSTDGGAYKGPPGQTWWHIVNSDYSEFRAAGFSPSGRTLAVATSSDLTLWTRPALNTPYMNTESGPSLKIPARPTVDHGWELGLLVGRNVARVAVPTAMPANGEDRATGPDCPGQTAGAGR